MNSKIFYRNSIPIFYEILGIAFLDLFVGFVRHDYPMAKTFLLYGGSTRLEIKGISVIPVSEFLMKMDEFCG